MILGAVSENFPNIHKTGITQTSNELNLFRKDKNLQHQLKVLLANRIFKTMLMFFSQENCKIQRIL